PYSLSRCSDHRDLHSFPTRRSSDLSVLPRTGITEVDLVVLDPPRAGAGRKTVEHLSSLGARRIAYVACDPAALARDLAYFREGGDRKSTRLNSSHVKISYAVFCLKK